MSRYTGPKIRLSRRFGIQLFGRKDSNAKKYELSKKNYPPGQHGQSKIGKTSEFGKQLMEKQKARLMFGITEKQMRNYYIKAASSKTATGEELIRLLECRLDNVVFRAGFAKTRMQARQMVSHGLINLSGRKTNIPSAQVKVDDTFEVRKKSKSSPLFIGDEKSKYTAPHWIESDTRKLSGKMVKYPSKDDFEKIIDPQPIVEFYSK